MNPQTPRPENPKTTPGVVAVVHGAVSAAVTALRKTASAIAAVPGLVAAGTLVVSAVGFSRPPSDAPEVPRPFEFTVRETRNESFHDAAADSLVTRRFESSLTYFGRVETSGRLDRARRTGRSKKTENAEYAVHTDSLLFQSDAPFRFTTLIRRDTVTVASLEKGPSTHAETLAGDKEMFACIFEGPALAIRVSEIDGSAELQDLKTQCPGGLYRRLNLPVTLGAFVFRLPSGRYEQGGRWETAVTCPSFSGLGLTPTLNLTYEVVEATTGGAPMGVEIACDSTLTNVRVVTPGGHVVDIVSNRIRIRGLLRPWPGVLLFHAGRLSLEEDIRYVRPDLESPVLEKRCRTEILLEPR